MTNNLTKNTVSQKMKSKFSLSLSLKTFCIFDFIINTNNLGPLALSQGKTITGRKYLRQDGVFFMNQKQQNFYTSYRIKFQLILHVSNQAHGPIIIYLNTRFIFCCVHLNNYHGFFSAYQQIEGYIKNGTFEKFSERWQDVRIYNSFIKHISSYFRYK